MWSLISQAFTPLKSACQPFSNLPGFRPYPLPRADRYVLKNRMSVNSLASSYSASEDCIVVFGDNVKFENVYLTRQGGNAKHLLIIANTITIGSNNLIVSRSDNRNGGDADGGSVILMCKKLRFETGSSMFFLGTAINFQAFKTGTQPPVYTGSYGAQLLFIAEKIEVSTELRENVVDDHLSAYDEYVKYLIEDDNRTKILRGNTLKIYLNGSAKILGTDKI